MNASPLLTRCAHCLTVFRVTAEQLRARAGQVRCGRCLQVFDGLAGLQAGTAGAGAEVAQTGPATASTPEAGTAAAAASASGGDTAATVAVAAAADAVAAAATEREPSAAPQAPGASAATAVPELAPPVSAPSPAPEPAPATATDNPFIAPAAPPQPRRRAYALASALMLLALAGQGVYAYRGDIAARHALAREWIVAACAVAGCTVEMPQRPRQVVIEGSDLQALDPARPERIQLTATLRNHAGHAVGFPALDLVLTNANDHTLARRIFLPEEYLPGAVDRSAGLAAQAEMTVRLTLDAGDLGAAGFRLAVLAAAP
jgi:predicted Zn finger-like uncharacterized protein